MGSTTRRRRTQINKIISRNCHNVISEENTKLSRSFGRLNKDHSETWSRGWEDEEAQINCLIDPFGNVSIYSDNYRDNFLFGPDGDTVRWSSLMFLLRSPHTRCVVIFFLWSLIFSSSLLLILVSDFYWQTLVPTNSNSNWNLRCYSSFLINWKEFKLIN